MVNDFTYNNTIYIMNKLLKYTLGILTIWICLINTTKAELIYDKINYILEQTWINIWYTPNTIQTLDNTTYWTYCYQISNINKNWYQYNYPIVINSTNNQTQRWNNAPIYIRPDQENKIFCYYYNQNYINTFIWWSISSSATRNWTYDIKVFKLDTLINEDITCQTCEEQYTSLECQTEYNLIPITSVTENYCKLNFDLIAPTECPNIWEWTWEINRTARYINNTQYPWTASLKLNIADFLERQTTYNENETIIEVLWYDADENYINWIIAKEQLTPTPQDFETLIVWLQEFIPYIFIAMIIAFFLMLVKRFFR